MRAIKKIYYRFKIKTVSFSSRIITKIENTKALQLFLKIIIQRFSIEKIYIADLQILQVSHFNNIFPFLMGKQICRIS